MKRSGNQLIFALAILSIPSLVNCNFTNYFDGFKTEVDRGAAKTCYLLGGTLEQFNPNSIEQGHKCTYTASVWTTSTNAEEFCASNTPYPVIPSLARSMDGGKTQCGYLITLKCKNDWWLIDGLCYKAADGMLTFPDAKAHCKKLDNLDTEPKLAEFYSTTLGMFLEHMMFSEAWVTVPDITEYFLDGVGEAAVFVNDGAFKYDTKQGTLIMEKEHEKHPALCQYKPATTMAEVYRRAKEYEEIYPIHTHDNGINVVTSSYLTVHQENARKFDTNEIRERCNSIGKIINVESFPVAPVEFEWNEVRPYLKDHRFCLTGAFKNEGCQMTDFRNYEINSGTEGVVFPDTENKYRVCNAFSFSFNENKRAPSVAGMRAPAICALHSYSFTDAQCDSDWISYKRADNSVFCHRVYVVMLSHVGAKAACLEQGGALTGFDSADELQTVRAQITRDSHYSIGAVVPCQMDCYHGSRQASWENGVASNTEFLNTYKNDPIFWKPYESSFVTYRSGWDQFHIHNYDYDYYICGKYALFLSKKIEKKQVRSVKK